MTTPPADSTSRPAESTTLGAGAQPLDSASLRSVLPRLLDALTDAVVVVDRLGHVIAANARFHKAFGFDPGRIEGRACPRAGRCATTAPKSETCLACDIARTKQPRRALQVVPDASGQQRRWEAMLNPLLDERGEVEMVVEVWRDVTERTHLEAQLSHSERLASLGMLAAGVAHEVNNPLASMLAGVESLERWLARARMPEIERAEAAEVLGLLEQETRRCRETTDKLLLLGQPYSTRPVWIDVNRAARDTLALLSFATRRQRIQVDSQLDDTLPPVWGREGALRGVLMNLCMNAVQALQNGGHLSLRTQGIGEGRVAIEVIDDGPGIAPEHLARIWDPFFTTKPVGQGTGLGLSITRSIVTRHGGEIQVDSAPGQGARFTITLPTEGSGGESV